MTTRIYYDDDADIREIRSRRVAVVGYGSQGHAHAQNLRDSGVDVRVGARPDGRAWNKAKADGFTAERVGDATSWANVVMILAPDTSQPRIYRDEIAPNLAEGDTLMFAHGFNIRYGTIVPATASTCPWWLPRRPVIASVRSSARAGGTPALVAVHQDATGGARGLALSYARGIGCTRAGVIETTFTEETETDLFGEQAVLCGGVSALVKAGFETLVAAGYKPEIAYFECLHELKLIVDLMQRGGLNYMRYSVSDTAEHGDYTGGPRIVTDETRAAMKAMLTEIQDGTYARAWIAENEAGRPWFDKKRREESAISCSNRSARGFGG